MDEDRRAGVRPGDKLKRWRERLKALYSWRLVERHYPLEGEFSRVTWRGEVPTVWSVSSHSALA